MLYDLSTHLGGLAADRSAVKLAGSLRVRGLQGTVDLPSMVLYRKKSGNKNQQSGYLSCTVRREGIKLLYNRVGGPCLLKSNPQKKQFHFFWGNTTRLTWFSQVLLPLHLLLENTYPTGSFEEGCIQLSRGRTI